MNINILSIPILFLAISNLFATICFIFLYLKLKKKESLYFSYCCITMCLFDISSFLGYNVHSLSEGIIFQRITMSMGFLIAVTVIWYLVIFTKRKNLKLTKILTTIMMIFFVATLIPNKYTSLITDVPNIKKVSFFGLGNATYYEYETSLLYTIGFVFYLITFYYIMFVLIKNYLKNKDFENLLFLIGLFIYCLTNLSDLLIAMGLYKNIYLGEYGFFVLIICMSYSLIRSYIYYYKEVEYINLNLEKLVEQRTLELNDMLKNLSKSQEQLLHSEKIVALHRLVAGVAHEINTPIGTCITASTFLESTCKDIENLLTAKTISKKNLENNFQKVSETSNIISINLIKVAGIIKNFKLVSSETMNKTSCLVNIHSNLNNIIKSLESTYSNKVITFIINCNEDITIKSFDCDFEQIITQLFLNSLIHGFENKNNGIVEINVKETDSNVIIIFKDNGVGINEEIIDKIFDPFFTTKRNKGCIGLGLNIVYNYVVDSLNGIINCESKMGIETLFTITCKKN